MRPICLFLIPCVCLADALQLDASILTPLLKRLQSAGFISRQRDTRDERVVRVSLTAAGRALCTPVAAIQKAVACRTALNDTEFAAFRSGLHQMAADLACATGATSSAARTLPTTNLGKRWTVADARDSH